MVRWPYRCIMGLSHVTRHPMLFSAFKRESSACARTYRNRKALILGTGRSLRGVLSEISTRIEADREKGPTLWAVNNFALSSEFVRLQPQNYVLLDPDFHSRTSVDGTAQRNALLSALSAVTWPMYLWIPMVAAVNPMWIEFFGRKPPNLRVVPFPSRTYEASLPLARAAQSLFGFAPNYQNVVTLSAFLALHFGASEVGLVGADHNWHQDMIVGEDNVLRTHVPHFDDKTARPAPTIFLHSVEKGAFRVSEIFSALSITFQGHEEVQSVAKRLGRNVINLTPQSFIDAYPRGNLSDWLNANPETKR